MLRVEKINNFYGKQHVLWDLSLEVGEECVGLFGPNGAGKTTLVNAILGVARPANGTITFLGKPIHHLPTHRIVRSGIAVVPQERELFPFMSVRGNLEAGAAYVPNGRERMEERLQMVFEMFPVLQARVRQRAGTLSGGEQRMLAIARALMADPKLIILDEPSLGLQPSLVSELFRKLQEIKTKVAVLVAEQNVYQALKAVDRGYVIENGRIVLEGDTEELSGNDHIRKSYLGL
ncbi:MAG TPA: ABC transporter ATP-binding protein [Candidatus Acetothermia bacterium]|nr:MAG: branched-chain amino acid ABC transporter ATP-binding protein [Candidatus Acetothermia bacterium]HDJ30015.1 ABC transporter ATP-binding protein [Candidatus Acetothermia bacterium]